MDVIQPVFYSMDNIKQIFYSRLVDCWIQFPDWNGSRVTIIYQYNESILNYEEITSPKHLFCMSKLVKTKVKSNKMNNFEKSKNQMHTIC